MGDEILVSGYEADFVAYKAPSGQWGTNLDAYLLSVGASFGFNLTPHKFSLQYVPSKFNGASGELPEIGKYTSFEVRQGSCSQGFLIAGNVVHSDYQNSSAGTAVRIEIEDRRLEVLDLKIATEDLGDNVPSNVVSVGEMYRETVGFSNTNSAASDARVKEYRNISELGATYQQIYEAIDWANRNGAITFDVTKLPHPNVLAANTLGNREPIRWKFSAIPLAQVISTVLSDTSYDWYWGMKDDSVKVVNRKVTFDVNEDDLSIQQLSPDSVNFRFGTDKVPSPSKVTVLGAHQEGFVNSDLLSPIDGMDSPAGSIVFTPAWTGIKISFIDAYGAYRSYFPTEMELQMALKSIEHWTYYKQNQSTVWSDGTDEGVEATTHPTFQSRLDPNGTVAEFWNNPSQDLRLVVNRVDANHNWVLEWYSRVQNHASSHYGRSYALESFSFDNDEGEYKVLDAAWCNLENQKSSNRFNENYEIDSEYAPIAPFVTQDFKVRAHCVLPSTTVYGIDGYQPPASFADWNEDVEGDLSHYIPINLKRVGQKVINPRADTNAFEDYPEGTIIAQLPILAGTRTVEEPNLATVAALFTQGAMTNQNTVADALNPYTLVEALATLTGVAIPVQARPRYGQAYPQAWTSGTGSGTRDTVIVNDTFAPWSYFPINTSTSIDVMNGRVHDFMNAKVVAVEESRFAEINKIDWPIVSFDSYANQNSVSGVYGRRDHGVTEISVSVNNGIPNTKYGIKSFFAEFGKEAPLGERNYGILEGIIHPIDFTEFGASHQGRAAPDVQPIGDKPTLPPAPPISVRKETYAVTITTVLNRGSATEPERYYSQTKDSVAKPGGVVDTSDSLDLICRDGFFNVGDHGLYIVEYKNNGQRRRYYTGGTDLTSGAGMAHVTAINANNVDVQYRGFSLTSVSTIGKDPSDCVVNEQGTIVTDGTMKPDNEGNITGLRPDSDVPDGVYFQPSSGTAAAGDATPVILTQISSFGTSGAKANVQGVVPSGTPSDLDFVGSGNFTNNVRIIPVPAFAQSGDIGILASNAGTNFVFINRQAYARFIG